MLPAPSATTVMQDVFHQTVANDVQVKLQDGRYASYWSGHTFRLAGKAYFVGFAEYTDAAENEYPAEADTVSLAEATYVQESGRWKLIGTHEGIGRFGAFNKPPQFDADEPAQGADVDGRYVVGIPSVDTAMAGARLSFFEVFAFDPGAGAWTYLGDVAGGRDTRAGCTTDAGAPQPVPCVVNRATLHFQSTGGKGWPTLTVSFDGKVVGDNGVVRKATSADSVVYRRDDNASTFTKIAH